MGQKTSLASSLSFLGEDIRAWLDNSPICTAIIDADLNLAFMNTFGIKTLQLTDIDNYYGKQFPPYCDSDIYRSSLSKVIRKVKETHTAVKLETFVPDTQNQAAWYDSTVIPLINENGVAEHFMVISMNVTEKKKDEETLKAAYYDQQAIAKQRTLELFRSEERFSLAMRGANDGLWDWDLTTNEVYYSPRWKSMLGYQESELSNEFATWEQLVQSEDKENTLQTVERYIANEIDSFDVEMRMRHKRGHYIFIQSRAFLVHDEENNKPVRLVGTHIDITERKKAEMFAKRHTEILEMIAIGRPASEIYDAIALMYEEKHNGLRCSMLELHKNKLMHGGAPSLPKAYCDAVHGLENGPNVGSCGASTYTGERVIVENIETNPNWEDLKDAALPHGMRCCWSEPIKSSSGKVLGAFGMYYNHTALPNDEESVDLKSAARLAGIVMERDQANKRIRELAYKDELTGLASRAYFYQHLEELITKSERYQQRFSLLYIDLDNFKTINDSYGHDIGDVLLKEIANRLTEASRKLDFVARLSGDEFCILVEDTVKDYASAAHTAQRCLTLVSAPMRLANRKHIPTCSIGIAHYPDDGENSTDLLKAADTSLYSAKEQGKNTIAFYKPEFTQKAETRFIFEQYLKEAIEKQELTLAYQLQIDIKNNNIIGVEALSRWNHPVLGNVPTIDFIRAAEEIGMIKPLTEWVLETACKQVVEWENLGAPNIRIAVNISPNHFLDKDLVSLVKKVLDETGMTPSNLELEVTEGVVQTNPNNLATFKQLKELGVQLAIDDFGTGYSSFASLKHIKVDYLKIDKYFIDDICSDNETRLLVGSMIEMGHNLGCSIIAEGIETEEQLSLLNELGCDTGQGYLLGKPITHQDFSLLLAAQNTQT